MMGAAPEVAGSSDISSDRGAALTLEEDPSRSLEVSLEVAGSSEMDEATLESLEVFLKVAGSSVEDEDAGDLEAVMERMEVERVVL